LDINSIDWLEDFPNAGVVPVVRDADRVFLQGSPPALWNWIGKLSIGIVITPRS
jgi:hypothetical protein